MSSCHYVARTGSYSPAGCQNWGTGGSHSHNYGYDDYTGYGGTGGSGYHYGYGGSGHDYYGGNSYHGGGSQKESGKVTVVVLSGGYEETHEIPLADLTKPTLHDVKYNLMDDLYVYIPKDYTWKDWQHKALFEDNTDLAQEEMDKIVGDGDWYYLVYK